ncbi:transcriptional regulator, AsnC family protein [Oceanicola granulosus HTCC2516]|uniref:Transcriptional regulator, AsnC family protein n=1 Tax=Oceanicola granulosus (strain ATCC BAA-861 / DSM 15982 / KCTC 12143 / HTCC2516) TaxID=314256 RepID=Q2CET3_OCEGH|nr:Lrp/AsnC family transcriptional regulator [Oceanicola granulosus]EAR51175.1 transcriptional regulator, AsnC family protein [Oceanicola granulosus HTCC2516]
MQLDEPDRRILRVIQERPGLTMRELGAATGLSHSPCWRRLQRLQQAGIVSEKRYIVDPEAAGFEIVVFCFLRMAEHRRDRLAAFEAAVERVPEVLQCYSLSGEHDYLLQVVARSVRDYEQTVKNALLELPDVQSINTSFTLKRIKDSRVIPV